MSVDDRDVDGGEGSSLVRAHPRYRFHCVPELEVPPAIALCELG